ncbi:hypothetical protein ABTD06_19270, partial [Acinetobacter baumannii]
VTAACDDQVLPSPRGGDTAIGQVVVQVGHAIQLGHAKPTRQESTGTGSDQHGPGLEDQTAVGGDTPGAIGHGLQALHQVAQVQVRVG